jgi:hypothetical protein
MDVSYGTWNFFEDVFDQGLASFSAARTVYAAFANEEASEGGHE